MRKKQSIWESANSGGYWDWKGVTVQPEKVHVYGRRVPYAVRSHLQMSNKDGCVNEAKHSKGEYILGAIAISRVARLMSIRIHRANRRRKTSNGLLFLLRNVPYGRLLFLLSYPSYSI